MERLGKLPLSDEEKGRIFGLLSDEQLEKAMPSFLSDEAVAVSLRIKFLAPVHAHAPSNRDEVAALVASVRQFPLDGGDQPTREALERYLLDFRCLEGLVPVASKSALTIELPQGLQRNPFFYSGSDLGVVVAHALQGPRAGSGEMVANSRMLEFFDIFDCLKSFSGVGSRLDYHLTMDRVETATWATSTQTARCRKRKRPDFLFDYEDFLFLLGEGKDDERQFTVAKNEISAKLNKVPDWVYGNVHFLLAFALAGFKTQLFVKRASVQEPERLAMCYALNKVADRVGLVLVTIKLYFLCLSICKRVAPTGMLPLFKKHARSFSTIELDGEGCVKTIEKWNEYTEKFGVSLKDVKKAYKITGVDQLVYAMSPPTVSTNGRYMVRTAPLGLPAKRMLTNEHEYKGFARDMLAALAALHEVNLVHRDVRLDNVVWWPGKKCYVLIDLETVATHGKTKPELFTDYIPSTLVDGKYVKSSDLHQLGVLLENLMPLSEVSCRAFVKLLKSHQSTAKALSTHAWLLPKVEASTS